MREADDDVSALLSAVISKVAIFGLLLVAYVAIRSEVSLNLAHLLGWIGMLTTLVGAMLAVSQNDMKRMLAYSSMSQLGYIVAAISLMSHLGWVTALYLVANHLMVKGILFLVVAGIIIRTGTRHFDDLGGLARVMPFTFASCDHCHCCDVGPAAARRVRRQMAAIERDDGKRLVRTGRDDAAGDLCRLSLHGAFYPCDLFRALQSEASQFDRSATCLAHTRNIFSSRAFW